MYCTKCGKPIQPRDANYCWNCGWPQKEGLKTHGAAYCWNCGKAQKDEQKIYEAGVCQSCGKPDKEERRTYESSFCLKCGKPLKVEGKTSNQDHTRYEICVIGYKDVTAGVLLPAQFRFVAEVTKKDSKPLEVGCSSKFEGGITSPSEDARKALNQLKEELIKKGWEEQGKANSGWFSYQFRRKIKKLSSSQK